MSNVRAFFGTDGIRGKVGTGFMTPDFALELGRAVGTVFNSTSKLLVARDTRLSGEMLQAAISSGICSTGVSVCDLGVLPTPACAYLTKYLNADAGVVISASHNPYYDNGIKFFAANGNKLSDAQELSLENIIITNRNSTISTIRPNRIGDIETNESLSKHYVHYCLDLIKNSNSESALNNIKKLKVVLDCSNGAAYKVAPEVFSYLGIDLTVIHDQPNGFNINQECGAADHKGLDSLAKKVKTSRADLGIALDGDGDRVIMVTASGQVIDGDQILYILACDYLNNNKNLFGIVGTQMSNLGLEQAIRSKGLDFIRTNVGDRYVVEKLLEKNWILGGETSGHILNLEQSTTGDGIVTSLMIIAAMARAEKSLDELVQGFYKYPQVMINVSYSSDYVHSKDILELPTIKSAISDVTRQLSNKGRVLVRRSGTESLLRVMVEGESSKEVEVLATKLSNFIKSEIK
jgi:phosphoglucosamine mutase